MARHKDQLYHLVETCQWTDVIQYVRAYGGGSGSSSDPWKTHLLSTPNSDGRLIFHSPRIFQAPPHVFMELIYLFPAGLTTIPPNVPEDDRYNWCPIRRGVNMLTNPQIMSTMLTLLLPTRTETESIVPGGPTVASNIDSLYDEEYVYHELVDDSIDFYSPYFQSWRQQMLCVLAEADPTHVGYRTPLNALRDNGRPPIPINEFQYLLRITCRARPDYDPRNQSLTSELFMFDENVNILFSRLKVVRTMFPHQWISLGDIHSILDLYGKVVTDGASGLGSNIASMSLTDQKDIEEFFESIFKTECSNYNGDDKLYYQKQLDESLLHAKSMLEELITGGYLPSVELWDQLYRLVPWAIVAPWEIKCRFPMREQSAFNVMIECMLKGTNYSSMNNRNNKAMHVEAEEDVFQNEIRDSSSSEPYTNNRDEQDYYKEHEGRMIQQLITLHTREHKALEVAYETMRGLTEQYIKAETFPIPSLLCKDNEAISRVAPLLSHKICFMAPTVLSIKNIKILLLALWSSTVQEDTQNPQAVSTKCKSDDDKICEAEEQNGVIAKKRPHRDARKDSSKRRASAISFTNTTQNNYLRRMDNQQNTPLHYFCTAPYYHEYPIDLRSRKVYHSMFDNGNWLYLAWNKKIENENNNISWKEYVRKYCHSPTSSPISLFFDTVPSEEHAWWLAHQMNKFGNLPLHMYLHNPLGLSSLSIHNDRHCEVDDYDPKTHLLYATVKKDINALVKHHLTSVAIPYSNPCFSSDVPLCTKPTKLFPFMWMASKAQPLVRDRRQSAEHRNNRDPFMLHYLSLSFDLLQMYVGQSCSLFNVRVH